MFFFKRTCAILFERDLLRRFWKKEPTWCSLFRSDFRKRLNMQRIYLKLKENETRNPSPSSSEHLVQHIVASGPSLPFRIARNGGFSGVDLPKRKELFKDQRGKKSHERLISDNSEVKVEAFAKFQRKQTKKSAKQPTKWGKMLSIQTPLLLGKHPTKTLFDSALLSSAMQVSTRSVRHRTTG